VISGRQTAVTYISHLSQDSTFARTIVQMAARLKVEHGFTGGIDRRLKLRKVRQFRAACCASFVSLVYDTERLAARCFTPDERTDDNNPDSETETHSAATGIFQARFYGASGGYGCCSMMGNS
jgi:hypothetical protein